MHAKVLLLAVLCNLTVTVTSYTVLTYLPY